MDEARERENRRWWLLWHRRGRTSPASRAHVAQIMAVVAREGRLGDSSLGDCVAWGLTRAQSSHHYGRLAAYYGSRARHYSGRATRNLSRLAKLGLVLVLLMVVHAVSVGVSS